MKGRHEKEGIPYQRADICASSRPLLDYRAGISEGAYRRHRDRSVCAGKAEDLSAVMRSVEDNKEGVEYSPVLLQRIDSRVNRVSLGSEPEPALPENDINSMFKIVKIEKRK